MCVYFRHDNREGVEGGREKTFISSLCKCPQQRRVYQVELSSEEPEKLMYISDVGGRNSATCFQLGDRMLHITKNRSTLI